MSDHGTIKDAVKTKYGAVARGKTSVCCEPGGSCDSDALVSIAQGYSAEELASLPEGSELGLGCGNPTALAEINPGEIVVDLGSGAGVDCFLASRKVGERGLVIGIDMTEDMLAKARANAAKGGFANVQFRLGEIDNLPIDTSTVDLVISNCVINLAPDKERVFREIYRVLRPGGRLCVSDVVSKGEIPDTVRNDMEKWAGCIAGALEKDEYLGIITKIGFGTPEIRSEVDYEYEANDQYTLASVTVIAQKPGSNGHHQ